MKYPLAVLVGIVCLSVLSATLADASTKYGGLCSSENPNAAPPPNTAMTKAQGALKSAMPAPNASQRALAKDAMTSHSSFVEHIQSTGKPAKARKSKKHANSVIWNAIQSAWTRLATRATA